MTAGYEIRIEMKPLFPDAYRNLTHIAHTCTPTCTYLHTLWRNNSGKKENINSPRFCMAYLSLLSRIPTSQPQLQHNLQLITGSTFKTAYTMAFLDI